MTQTVHTLYVTRLLGVFPVMGLILPNNISEFSRFSAMSIFENFCFAIPMPVNFQNFYFQLTYLIC